MINLIPNEEKKEMIKGFYYKLVVLFFISISVCMLIAFISILPAYVLSSEKNNLANAKLELQKNEPVPIPDQQTLSIINDLDKKLTLVETAESKKFIFSQNIINPIILKKTPEIKLTDISYQNDPIKGRKVSIGGVAPSREVLLSFREALEEDAAFKNVDLPISNFIQGSNIQFSLTLTPS